MAFSAVFPRTAISHISSLPHSPTRKSFRFPSIQAVKSTESEKLTQTKNEDAPSNAQPPTTAPIKRPKKPVYSMKKGQIVRVDKEKYLNSVNVIASNSFFYQLYFLYLSVGHPPYYKGLDYIYEDRGEVLDLRIFDTGEYALVAWVGIPTAPAWLPTDMLIQSDKLNYERI